MHRPKPLRFAAFGDDALSRLPRGDQQDYLRCYLHDLGARWVLEEPYYFDRDFLDEFAAFYSTSARGYKNACRRLLFFSALRTTTSEETRAVVSRALTGELRPIKRLEKAFLGFSVVRPIPATRLGRTVLRWYPERLDALPRVCESKRKYEVHVLGLKLEIEGLAWQQQDSAVGACATVGVWTMLHSSAFDERLAIPTTAAITRAAHRTASLGDRMFPSAGLSNQQLMEAIKEHGLAPMIRAGDMTETDLAEILAPGVHGEADDDGGGSPLYPPLFSVRRFSSSCAALLRSGFPVLLSGKRGDTGHVVCVVGFRPVPPVVVPTGSVALDDSMVEHLYVHDDTLGPNVRFSVVKGAFGEASLVPDAPTPRRRPRPVQDPTENVEDFIPTELIVAVHNDVRISPDHVHASAIRAVQPLAVLIEKSIARAREAGSLENFDNMGLGLSIRYVRCTKYVGQVLADTLGSKRTVLARVRFSLSEQVPPLSLHLALVRVGMGGDVLFDILYDTTDSEPNLAAFAHVVFTDAAERFLAMLPATDSKHLGIIVRAY